MAFGKVLRVKYVRFVLISAANYVATVCIKIFFHLIEYGIRSIDVRSQKIVLEGALFMPCDRTVMFISF